MEENDAVMEENDAAGLAINEDLEQPYGVNAASNLDKRPFWTGGVFNCFSTVYSLFGREDFKLTSEDNWEVPAASIKNLVYLGRGAQGVVYGGVINKEIVAVKKLKDKNETDIKHLRKLNHENIVRFRGVCTQPPSYCVIMEFCQYGPLCTFLHGENTFLPHQIMQWAKETASGMAYLHSHKIIHRDLKSPNILIADNFVAKVSDFGTSREWNDVSAVMSFTGTVAWMAPEVIRHEPCSERVDVWSFGVVLWELLTQELPYKKLETNAILWGVGNDTMSLPIPSGCPGSLQLLLSQCWNRTPRHRPPFKIILAHLELAAEDITSIEKKPFNDLQVEWRKEVLESMENLATRSEQTPAQDTAAHRREELKHAREARDLVDQQLYRANELYLEACAVRLQLERRERELLEREKALKSCRCGMRKTLRFRRQASSSSDGIQENQRLTRLKVEPTPAQMMVVLLDNKPSETKTITVTVTDEMACECSNESMSDVAENNNIDNNNVENTVLETNGNIETNQPTTTQRNTDSDNQMPDVAHV